MKWLTAMPCRKDKSCEPKCKVGMGGELLKDVRKFRYLGCKHGTVKEE